MRNNLLRFSNRVAQCGSPDHQPSQHASIIIVGKHRSDSAADAETLSVKARMLSRPVSLPKNSEQLGIAVLRACVWPHGSAALHARPGLREARPSLCRADAGFVEQAAVVVNELDCQCGRGNASTHET